MAYAGFSTDSFSSASAVETSGSSRSGAEIVDEAVDLVEQTLPLLWAVTVFRHDRLLVLVEPVDHLDERSDRLELPAPDRLSDDTQGGHQAFELQMRVVGAAVDDWARKKALAR